jgi:hypothetical protein
MCYVINVVRDGLKSPESHVLHISFQNILNNHYDTVFDIIHCFNGLTHKDAKDFKVFEIKEMPQELGKIVFTNKYKKNVDKFYELLSKNPKCSEKFVELFDTLPHNIESAIFVLKCRIKSKKQLGGSVEKYGMTTRNMFRVLHAYYALGMNILILLGKKSIEKNFDVDVPLETGKTDPFFEPGVLGVNSGSGGLVGGMGQDDKYRDAVRDFSDRLYEQITEYLGRVNQSVIETEGYRELLALFTPENIGAYVNQIGLSVAIDTLVPLETLKLSSDVINFFLSQTADLTRRSKIKDADELKGIQEKLEVLKNNLEDVIEEFIQLVCFIKTEYVKKGMLEVDFSKSLEKAKRRQGLEMKIECANVKKENNDNLQLNKDAADVIEPSVKKENNDNLQLNKNPAPAAPAADVIKPSPSVKNTRIKRPVLDSEKNSLREKPYLAQGGALNDELNIITQTINNTKTSQTYLQRELTSIVFILKHSEDLISVITSTEGSSLRELQSKQESITNEYNELKNCIHSCKGAVRNDPILKN